MAATIRILLFADSHLGFDLPARPRVARRRRGHDFLANHERALRPALEGRVDIVVHGGDVFHRPRAAPELARRALQPLLEVADRGVPVFVVPGNHERGRLPACFRRYAGVHVFDRPRTFVMEVRGVHVALAGFPYERKSVRTRLPRLLRETQWTAARADVALLCIHHCVEGATVGPGDFTFTSASDVIRGRDIPASFAAVLSGHIHRRQVLTRDLRGRALPAPVLYPGSVERTSSAEIGEQKGYLMVDVGVGVGGASPGVRWREEPLPARPMLVRTLRIDGMDASAAEVAVRTLLAEAPTDAVLRLRIEGRPSPDAQCVLAAARIRAMAPDTMNVELSYRGPPGRTDVRSHVRTHAETMAPPQLDLGLPAAG